MVRANRGTLSAASRKFPGPEIRGALVATFVIGTLATIYHFTPGDHYAEHHSTGHQIHHGHSAHHLTDRSESTADRPKVVDAPVPKGDQTKQAPHQLELTGKVRPGEAPAAAEEWIEGGGPPLSAVNSLSAAAAALWATKTAQSPAMHTQAPILCCGGQSTPTVFVIGGTKSGTTSLFSGLQAAVPYLHTGHPVQGSRPLLHPSLAVPLTLAVLSLWLFSHSHCASGCTSQLV